VRGHFGPHRAPATRHTGEIMATPIAFKITQGDTALGTREFDQDIIKIGRLATAHLKLDDQKVSRIHAVVEVAASKDVSIIDMGSAEGTYVNGEKVNKVRLKDGDLILVGETKLEIVIGLTTVPSASAPTKSIPPSTPVPEVSGVFSRTGVPSPAAQRTASLPGTPGTSGLRAVSNPNLGTPPSAGGRVVSSPNFGTPAASSARAVSQPPMTPPPAAVEQELPPPEEAAPPPEPAQAFQPQDAGGDDGYDDDEDVGPYETPPEPVPDAARAVLELQVRWGMTVIEVQHHERTPLVTIGPNGDVHLLATEFAPPPRPLFTCVGTQYTLHVTSQFSGFLRSANKPMKDIKTVKGDADGAVKRITLSPDQSGELQINNLILAFRFVEPRRKVAAAPLGTLDYAWLNTFMSTVFMSVAFMATLILYPQDTKSLEEDLFQTNNRFTQFIVNPEKKPKNDFLKKLEDSKNKGQAPASAKNTSGKMGKQEQPKDKQGKAATKEDKRKKYEEAVAKSIDKLFAGGASSAVFSGGDTAALENVMGGIQGREVGAAYGFGGLGERGSGPGGGGTSTNTFGVGKIGTRGRGGGQSGYGAGSGGLGGKTEHSIDISSGAPVILGSLDKEIIRRVIRENIAQIKYCYERELTRTPGLNGKVQVKFVIGANGNVQSAVVAESSLGNKTAEGCMTGKVRGWVFPKPKGGGIVIVTYPFIFKQGG